MDCHARYLSIVSILFLAALVPAGIAQQQADTASSNTEQLTFPYMAVITGDNVNIRSGRGTQYYSCGKLNKADKVKVISKRFTWSRILPPVGTFSWISTQYVKVDAASPATGTVTGDRVRVYAGSIDGNPIHSITMQLKLDTGDKVHLLGEERDGYYKISPPEGAYLWINSEYAKPITIAPVKTEVKKPVRLRRPKTKPAKPAKKPAVVKEKGTAVKPVKAEKTSTAAERLQQYYALEKQIDTERAKPIEKQNYTNIKIALEKLTAGTDKASRYAKFTLGQIKHYELAINVNKALKQQDVQMSSTIKKIKKAHDKKVAGFEDLGRFAAIGKFAISRIYGQERAVRHYTISDAGGKVICYALPADPAANIDKYLGQRVGLVGAIEPHQPTSGALVRFTEIVKLEK